MNKMDKIVKLLRENKINNVKKIHLLPNFNIHILREFSNYDWDWRSMHKSKCFNIDLLREFINKNWNWNNIHNSPNFEIQMMIEFPDKNWVIKKVVKYSQNTYFLLLISIYIFKN